MAVRQYIGARYVTKIYENSLDPSTAEWEASVNYEPLTMVTYNNGSYLSKKEVPANVGDPASNPTYWVQTGFYNGQIAQLNQDIADINAALEAIVTSKNIIIVGDSYGTGYNPDGTTTPYPSIIKTRMGLSDDEIVNASLYDAAFSRAPSFKSALEQVESDIEDHDQITDIYVIGGYNDRSATATDVNTGMQTFKTYATAQYPNAKIHIILCANYRGNNTTIRNTLLSLKSVYATYAGLNGFTFNDVSEIFMSESDMSSDHYHPTQQGQNELASALISAIYDTSDYWRAVQSATSTYTAESPNTISNSSNFVFNIQKTVKDTILAINGYISGSFNLTGGAWNKLFKVDNPLLSPTSGVPIVTNCSINIRDQASPAHYITIPASIGYDGGYLSIFPIALNSNGGNYESYSGILEIAFSPIYQLIPTRYV